MRPAFHASRGRDGLGVTDQGRDIGEYIDLPAVSVKEMEGSFIRPDFVAQAHPPWPGSVLNLHNRFEMVHDHIDRNCSGPLG